MGVQIISTTNSLKTSTVVRTAAIGTLPTVYTLHASVIDMERTAAPESL